MMQFKVSEGECTMDEFMLIELIGKVMDERILILDDKMSRRMTALEENLDRKFENLQSGVESIKGDFTNLRIHNFIPELRSGILEIRQDNRALSHMYGEHSLEIEKLKS
jgi:hypothetical protein